ncbi:MAG: bifunctional RNase H/acid phosphatase [Bifidobacteriaceae bacterium]|nr:bifunctional RNase H/acid phosphatase [Bifidobacteriaceae bacterium]
MKLTVEADGGSRGNPGLAAFGALVRERRNGRVLAERAGYLGEAVTNNVAEYSGLIAGLKAAVEIDPEAELEVRMDSKLVVSQMDGLWKIKNPDLAKLAAEARSVLGDRAVKFIWVPRAQNQAADALANEAMDGRGSVSRDYPVEDEPAERDADDGSGAGSVWGVAGERPGWEVTAPGMSMADAVRIAEATTSGTQRHPGKAGPITTIVLVRHGMSTDTDRDVFAGGIVPGPPLSRAGTLQAQAAAAELVRMTQVPWFGLAWPDLLLSSPTQRALQTAQALGAALSLEVEVDAGFAEESFGLWDGMTRAEVDARWPDGVTKWAYDARYVPEGGESRQEVGARVKDALQAVAQANRGKTVVIAAHAMTTRAAIGVALGAPPDAWFSFRVAPASINVLRLWDLGYTEVVCTNRTAG